MDEEFSAKDFRTWNATMLAAVVLAVDGRAATTKTARRRAINAAVREVAEVLGNTTAVARRAYIDPRVFDRYQAGVTIARALRTLKEIDLEEERTRRRVRESGAEASVREAVPREHRRVGPSFSNDPDGGRLISVARPTRRTNRGRYSRKVDRADKSGARLVGWASFAPARGAASGGCFGSRARRAQERRGGQRPGTAGRGSSAADRRSLSADGWKTRSRRRRERSRSRTPPCAEQERAASEQTAHELEAKAREAERNAETVDQKDKHDERDHGSEICAKELAAAGASALRRCGVGGLHYDGPPRLAHRPRGSACP